MRHATCKQASRLQTLDLDNLPESLLRSIAHAWRAQRGGAAVPLLSKLTQSRGSGKMDWATFRALPDLFPELEELTAQFNIFLSNVESIDPAGYGAVPVPYQRLRVLTIHSFVASYTRAHLTTVDAGRILRNILTAVPNVEQLHIGHGAGWRLMPGVRNMQHATCTWQQFCMLSPGARGSTYLGVDGALAHLPASLKRLLSSMQHAHDAACSMRHAACGMQHAACSIQLATRLHVACRRLVPGGSAYPGVDGALAHLPTSLTRLSLSYFSLGPYDLEMATGLTSLRRLELFRCGQHARAAADACAARCPHLKQDLVKVSE